MRARTFLLVALMIGPPAFAGEEGCEWMNAASAAGYLKTAVQASVVKKGEGGSCDFSGTRGAERLDLWIDVTTLDAAKTPSCGAGAVPLRGTGNEAFVCSYGGESGKVSEQVVGRVRKQAFTVRLSSSGAVAKREELIETVCRAAEQVAGNLF
jgi:hypothetical protein